MFEGCFFRVFFTFYFLFFNDRPLKIPMPVYWQITSRAVLQGLTPPSRIRCFLDSHLSGAVGDKGVGSCVVTTRYSVGGWIFGDSTILVSSFGDPEWGALEVLCGAAVNRCQDFHLRMSGWVMIGEIKEKWLALPARGSTHHHPSDLIVGSWVIWRSFGKMGKT